MLKLENLSKYYYSSSSVTCALRKINLEFKVGEFIAITGESGSGKTTLLNIISGLDSYEDGELYYNGKKTSYFDDADWEQYRKEQIAFIFQNYNLIDSYTVLENVMVSYIIDGYSFKEAKVKAKEVLKFVGLQNDVHKRATKLSGGQKQRLAIARALAKDSQIIVADEPTGNLDAENGVAILELLKKVSKDKLVIVVTHNLGQIEPFITRKIRLHDGEVVADDIIEVIDEKASSKEKEVVKESSTKVIDKELEGKLKTTNEYIDYLNEMIENEHKAFANAKNDFVKKSIQSRIDAFKVDLKATLLEAKKIEDAIKKLQTANEVKVEKDVEKKKESKLSRILNFSFLNIKSQPKKGLLLLFLVFVSTLSSFVFWANFKMNINDNKTKELDTKIFTNLDDTRMLVRKTDSSVITAEILDEAKVDEVLEVEPYDYITDCNYYREADYHTKLAGAWTDPDPITGKADFIDTSSIILDNNDNFMRSYFCLDESDLSVGRLPTNDNEMVVYSKDASILDTWEKVLFRNEKKWSIGSYYQYSMKIVGLLKEPTNQAYFSENICKIMDISQYEIRTRFDYKVKLGSYGLTQSKSINFSKIVIDPFLGEYDISVPLNTIQALGKAIPSDENNVTIRYGNYAMYERFNIKMSEALTVASDAVGISQELFNKIYSEFSSKKQFAIFVSDYAYVDDVKAKLSKKGYEGLSCFEAAVSGYDVSKVIVRYVNLVVSILALLVINLVCVLLGYTILKVKKNDYVIFKMIGMSNSMCRHVNYVEVICYSILSSILLVIVSLIVKNTVTNLFILDVYKYIKFYDYLIIFAISLFAMVMLGKRYAKFITNKAKVTVLKEVE